MNVRPYVPVRVPNESDFVEDDDFLDDEHEPKAVLVGHTLELFHGELLDTGAWEGRREVIASETRHAAFVERSRER